tara:strand:- start:1 stop:384 length:384 start_codon:yes stop_codon:yes gene_type:complete
MAARKAELFFRKSRRLFFLLGFGIISSNLDWLARLFFDELRSASYALPLDYPLSAELCNLGIRITQAMQDIVGVFAKGRGSMAYLARRIRELDRSRHDWDGGGQAREFDWMKKALGGNMRIIQYILG